MSRYTNSHIYSPQKIRAMSTCFGLTQGDIESEYSTPFLSSLSFLFFYFFPMDLRLACVCAVIGTTRYFWRSLFFIILLYRRLLWRTGDIVKKIPITLYHPLVPGEHEIAFSRISLFFIILSSNYCWCTRCVDTKQKQSVASAILATTLPSVRNTTTLIITPRSYLWKCIHVSFVWIIIHGIRVGYL